MKRLIGLLPLLLGACADEGNDSGIFDGASLLIVVVLVVIVGAILLFNSRR